jgi:hypothetical protein
VAGFTNGRRKTMEEMKIVCPKTGNNATYPKCIKCEYLMEIATGRKSKRAKKFDILKSVICSPPRKKRDLVWKKGGKTYYRSPVLFLGSLEDSDRVVDKLQMEVDGKKNAPEKKKVETEKVHKERAVDTFDQKAFEKNLRNHEIELGWFEKGKYKGHQFDVEATITGYFVQIEGPTVNGKFGPFNTLNKITHFAQEKVRGKPVKVSAPKFWGLKK